MPNGLQPQPGQSVELAILGLGGLLLLAALAGGPSTFVGMNVSAARGRLERILSFIVGILCVSPVILHYVVGFVTTPNFDFWFSSKETHPFAVLGHEFLLDINKSDKSFSIKDVKTSSSFPSLTNDNSIATAQAYVLDFDGQQHRLDFAVKAAFDETHLGGNLNHTGDMVITICTILTTTACAYTECWRAFGQNFTPYRPIPEC